MPVKCLGDVRARDENCEEIVPYTPNGEVLIVFFSENFPKTRGDMVNRIDCSPVFSVLVEMSVRDDKYALLKEK